MSEKITTKNMIRTSQEKKRMQLERKWGLAFNTILVIVDFTNGPRGKKALLIYQLICLKT